MDPSQIPMMLIMYAALLFSICVHESLHAYSADRCGDPTARMLGRITLNPIPHIDPIGTLLFPIMGMLYSGFIIGWAKPVPVNPRNFRNPRRDDIIVSLAGIAGNFSIAVAAALLLRFFGLLYRGGLPVPEPVLIMLIALMRINVILGVFNLIPIPPLDGSHVLEHFLSYEAAIRYRQFRRYGFLVLLALLWTGLLGYLLVIPISLISLLAGIH